MAKEKTAKEPKQKTRAKTRLKGKLQKNKSRHKSEDLAKLTEDYNAFCKRLDGLVKALVNQHAAMKQLSKAKYQVAQHLAILSKDTVLYEATGQAAGVDRSTDSVNSYFSIHEGCSNKNSMYADKFKQFVIDYAQEWYKTITERVGAGLEKAETMRIELDHYQTKVEALRLSANSTMAKGKQVDSKAAEKLTRNEDKLIKAKESASKYTNDLCLLMEEITARSWRDLHPLLIKCSQFEVQVSGDEAKSLATLSQVVASLKKVATDHGIKPQARLKDLANLDPHVLSTRSKEDNLKLSIENGLSGFSGLGLSNGSTDGSAYGDSASVYSSAAVSVYSSATASDKNSEYFPPGSTAPQGLGGFPVRVQSSESISSSGAPSTMSMMNINAAPAPTMDTMAQAFGSGSVSGSAPNINGAASFGNSAPPPGSAPPPPPPMPPPPPPADFNSHGQFGAGAASQSSYGAPTSPSPYGVPASGGPPAQSLSMYGGGGNSMYGGGGGYPQQQQKQPQQQPHMGGGGYAQQQQQSPMPMSMGGGYSQQQQQSPMGGGFSQQNSPMGGNFSQQHSPMGGNFSQQQQQPMGGGNFAQQSSMFASPPPQQKQQHHPRSAPPSYGHNPFG